MRAAKLKITYGSLRDILQLPTTVEIMGVSADAEVTCTLYLEGGALPEVPEYGLFPSVELRVVRESHPDCPGYQKVTTSLEGL